MDNQLYDDNDIEEQNESESAKKPLLVEQQQTSVQSQSKLSKNYAASKPLTSAIYQYSTYRKNRRIIRRPHDQWNRKFLGILITALVLSVYIFLVNQPSNEQQVTPIIIVNVPPQDETLPGPKGEPNNINCFDIFLNIFSSEYEQFLFVSLELIF